MDHSDEAALYRQERPTETFTEGNVSITVQQYKFWNVRVTVDEMPIEALGGPSWDAVMRKLAQWAEDRKRRSRFLPLKDDQ